MVLAELPRRVLRTEDLLPNATGNEILRTEDLIQQQAKVVHLMVIDGHEDHTV